ncbi:MAG TPA: Sir2 family NAD-dependent protein deacetylase [Tepidisphaeraceae bacterium]|jgi:NAD-dependent SIR2 family protein deacetylase
MSDVAAVEKQIETVAQWLAESEHLAAFTGAGISTDSGIPDFRGPNGAWTRRDKGLPPPQWKVRPDQVRPNASHLALVELQNIAKLKFLITQNTDNLHRASGIRSELIAELHGNGQLVRCMNCDGQYPLAEVGWDRSRFGPGYRTQTPVPGQPNCPKCAGRLISSVVNFGDPMPEKEMRLAAHHAQGCDLMLALGSSLMVEPAASLVGIALRSGARLVLVNQGQTPYDKAATLRSWAGIAEVIPPAVERVKRAVSR